MIIKVIHKSNLITRSLLNPLKLSVFPDINSMSPEEVTTILNSVCIITSKKKKKILSHRYLSLKRKCSTFLLVQSIPKTLLLCWPTAQLETPYSYFTDYFSFSKHVTYFLLLRILLYHPQIALTFNLHLSES